MYTESGNSAMFFVAQAAANTARGKVRIFDTTLRDGEQTPGVHINAAQKVEIAQRLEAFGVATIEAGFPASSQGDSEAVKRVAQTITRCEVAALARCVKGDIDAAIDALQSARTPVLHVVLGTSDIHLRDKLAMSRSDAIRHVRESVAYARQHVDIVEFSLEDATRTERPFVHQVVRTAVEAGASRINIADTVGCAMPCEFGTMIDEIVRRVGPEVIVSAHCHNDMGLATANTVAAVQHGARQVEVTVNGIGERAGNTSLEEVAVALTIKGIASTGVDLTQIASLSARVEELTHVARQPNRPIVGANAFAHSSGIHQDGIIKNPRNYEFVPPAMVGVRGHRFVFTARSGRSAIAHHARSIGHDLSPGEIEAVYLQFVKLADQAEAAVPEHEINLIIKQVVNETTAIC